MIDLSCLLHSLLENIGLWCTHSMTDQLMPCPASTLQRSLAMVVVGFPATPPLLTRARMCISASHTHVREAVSLGLLLLGKPSFHSLCDP